MKEIFFILTTLLVSCKPSVDDSQRTLIGRWRVDKIVSPDSVTREDNRREYNSVPDDGGSLLYMAKELNAVIELGENGRLKTTLVFTTFGDLVWTTNKDLDSLTLKLSNVHDGSLINEGVVDRNGDMYFYEGKVKFVDKDNVDWIFYDGRTFKLKRENASQKSTDAVAATGRSV